MAERPHQQGVTDSRGLWCFALTADFFGLFKKANIWCRVVNPVSQPVRVLGRRWYERTYSPIENGYALCPQHSARGLGRSLPNKVWKLSYLILFWTWGILSSGIILRCVVQRKSAYVLEEFGLHLQSRRISWTWPFLSSHSLPWIHKLKTLYRSICGVSKSLWTARLTRD
jgi:hypothetical protein